MPLNDPRHATSEPGRPQVAVIHDYLTQRGGAERVVLSMLEAFPDATVHTSFYEPATTFPAFAQADVRVLGLNRIGLLRRHHRLALPLLGPSFTRLRVDAEVAVCSSSGWAHGANVTGRKIVYCYSPARWLYQTERYLGDGPSLRRVGLRALRSPLMRWDHRAGATVDRYIAISQVVRDRIRETYGRDAEVLPAPVAVDVNGSQSALTGVDPGFVLCVSRLLAYKNVGAVVDAFRLLPHLRLVVVGTGPLGGDLRVAAPGNVVLSGAVSDSELRWLYSNCLAVVAASYEDYGLTPLEGAAFGKPTAALRWGGFLDTVVEGKTGLFFDSPDPARIAASLTEVEAARWFPESLAAHAEQFGEERFVRRLREIVAEELRT